MEEVDLATHKVTALTNSEESLPGDFTFFDFQAPLGHVAHPLLALLATVHGEIVDIRSFFCHLKVTDTAVPL